MRSYMFVALALGASFVRPAVAQDDAELDRVIKQAMSGQPVTAEDLSKVMPLYNRKVKNGQPTPGMLALVETLREAEPAVVGPENTLRMSDEPLKAFRMAYVSHLAETLPPEQLEKHPTADLFPGPVPKGAERVTETIQINRRALGWISTGLYAPPGELLTVRLPRNLADDGLKLRIGPHTADIRFDNHKVFRRYHSIDRVYDLNLRQVDVASAFGGLIYIVLPKPKDPAYSEYHGDYYGTVDNYVPPKPLYDEIVIQGAVKAPLYVHGTTELSEWRRSIRNHPAPWAELATEKVIFTLPSSAIRGLADPTSAMDAWDRVLDAMADLRGSPRDRPLPMRFMIDAHVNYGAAYAGYPINAPLGWIDGIVAGKAHWGHVHELGHLHQYKTWTFQNGGEVTVNLFSLYALETVYNERSQHRDAEKFAKRVRQWLAKPDAERDWTQNRQAFFERLNLYIVLIEEFGWDPLKNILRDYRELPLKQHPQSDRDRAGDFALRYSKEVNKNLFPLFDAWGVRVSPRYAEEAEKLPTYTSPLIERIMRAAG